MRNRRKWFVATIGGADITVYAADPKTVLSDDGEELEAVYDIERSHVLIGWHYEHSRACVLALHELLHACFAQVGYGHSLPALLRCKPDELTDIEENIVTHLAPALLAGLVASKLLRFPKFPRKRREDGEASEASKEPSPSRDSG